MYLWQFSLQSRKEQLESQIIEAQRLREDLENTKSRLLTGLQYQFYIVNISIDSMPPATGVQHVVSSIAWKVQSIVCPDKLIDI